MTQAIAGFVGTWAPSFESTIHRVELRNVRQGGNDFLAAVPLAMQSMWAGTLMAEVAAVVSGPLAAIAQFFRIVFSPFVSFPLSIFACAAKENFYEKSVSATATAMTKYYMPGDAAAEPIRGTVTLLIDGQERYFRLGDEISWYIRHTIEDNGKRYWFERLEAADPFDENCREVEMNGERVRIRLSHETTNRKYIEQVIDGEKQYYELESEVDEPIQGTVEIAVPDDEIDWGNPVFRRSHILNEVPEEAPGCITIRSNEMTLFYDTGLEIDEPHAHSKTFMIDGEPRHFETAKYVRYETEGLSGWINKLSQRFIHCSILPTRLGKWTSKALTFVNQHLSNIIRVAILAASVSLIYFGQIAMALGAFSAVAYEYLDHDLGVIPQKVSLFMEKWMPTISMVGLLIVGSVLSQITAAITLLLTIPSVQLFIHQKVAKVVRQAMLGVAEPLILWFTRDERRPPQLDDFLNDLKAYPSLEEFDAPLPPRSYLNAAEIEEILQAEPDSYELNPASLTKNVEPQIELEEDMNFSRLIELWDRVGDAWITPASYDRILKRLADDKRFILFLQERFPEVKRFYFEEDFGNREMNRQEQNQLAWNEYLVQIEDKIRILAQEKEVTKERFAADWAKKQLENFVNKIGGNRPIEGEQKYLRDAIENTSKILPFLNREDVNRVDLEDSLLKLAIEGGDYCSLAMQRASNEVLQGFIEPLIEERERDIDPNQKFENTVLREFQKNRLRAMQGFYQMVTGWLKDKEQFQDVADDIHLYMAITRSMKRGFYPMTEEEMGDFSFTDLLFNETMLLPLRVGLKKEFEKKIPDAMNALGMDLEHMFHDDVLGIDIPHNKMLNYLRSWIQANDQLTDEERELLLNGPFAVNGMSLADVDNYGKWGRLMLTILGIYRKKPEPVREEAVAVAREPVLVRV